MDQFHFRLGAASTDAVFDVISWEPFPGGGTYTAADFFGNGDNNDFLVCNIYLFQADTALVFERTGPAPYYEWTSKFNGRSRKNPVVNVAGMAAGDYVFSLGVNMLSQMGRFRIISMSSFLPHIL